MYVPSGGSGGRRGGGCGSGGGCGGGRGCGPRLVGVVGRGVARPSAELGRRLGSERRGDANAIHKSRQSILNVETINSNPRQRNKHNSHLGIFCDCVALMTMTSISTFLALIAAARPVIPFGGNAGHDFIIDLLAVLRVNDIGGC